MLPNGQQALAAHSISFYVAHARNWEHKAHPSGAVCRQKVQNRRSLVLQKQPCSCNWNMRSAYLNSTSSACS